MRTDKAPKVSVCVITYNQEKFIRQCLQSILDQKTDFDFEVIVGDDCSNDGTRAIVQEFAERYPGIVRTIYQETNTGGSKNNLDVHAAVRGKYIAHIDGDDFALPGKLSAQARILDQDASVNIVFHRMRILHASGRTVDDCIDVERLGDRRFSRGDLLRFGSIACHSSKMYRAACRAQLSAPTHVLDFFSDIEDVGDGYAYYLDEVLGTYRTGIGLTLSQDKNKALLLSHLEYFADKYPVYRRQIAANAATITLADLKNLRGTWVRAMRLWLRCAPFSAAILILRDFRKRLMFRIPK